MKQDKYNIPSLFLILLTLFSVHTLFYVKDALAASYSDMILVTANYTASIGVGNFSAKLTSVTYCGESLAPLGQRYQNGTNGAVIELWYKMRPKKGPCEVKTIFDKDPGHRLVSATLLHNIDESSPLEKYFNKNFQTTGANTPSTIEVSGVGAKNTVMTCTYVSYPAGGDNKIVSREPRYEFWKKDGFNGSTWGNVNGALVVTPTRTSDNQNLSIVWDTTKTMPWSAACANLRVKPPLVLTNTTPNPPTGGSATPPPATITVDLKVNGGDNSPTVYSGTNVALTWTSQNATGCVASGSWSGIKATSGLQISQNLLNSLATAAKYTFTLTCTGQAGSAQDSVSVNVVTGSLSAPVVSTFLPTASQVQLTQTPTLSWAAVLAKTGVPAPTKYAIQIAQDTAFTKIIHTKADITAPTNPTSGVRVAYQVPSGALNPGATYYWRVRSIASDGKYSNFSTYATLKIGYMVLNGFKQPFNNKVDSLRPEFTWVEVQGASYGVERSFDEGKTWAVLGGVVRKYRTSSDYMIAWSPAADLPRNRKVLLRAYATSATYGKGALSAVVTILTPNPPLVVSAASFQPANGSLQVNLPDLSWARVNASGTIPAPATYYVQVAKDSAFANVVYTNERDSISNSKVLISGTRARITSYGQSTTFEPATTYYWRVRSVASDMSKSAWSGIFSYRRGLYVYPVLQSPANESVVSSLRPNFTWKASPGATSYKVEQSVNGGTTWTVLSGAVKATSADGIVTWGPSVNLAIGKEIYWRVTPISTSYGTGATSQIFVFKTP